MAIIVMLKIGQFCFQIGCGPEQDAVQVLAPKGANQSLYEGMRNRHARNSLDFGYLEYPKIGSPLVKSMLRIVIRAEIFGQTVAASRTKEHPAQRLMN